MMHEDKDQQINTEAFCFCFLFILFYIFIFFLFFDKTKWGGMLSYINCTTGLGSKFNGNPQHEVGAGKRKMENGVFTFF